MKRIFVVSDTHGNARALEKVKNVMAESDYVIFLGDGASDVIKYRDMLKDKLYVVDGNCDGNFFGKKEGVLTVENHKIFYTHGDLYSVKRDLYRLNLKAKETGADVVLYGHTHIAKEESIDGTIFINPGNMSKYSCDATYAYVCVTESKVITTIVGVY